MSEWQPIASAPRDGRMIWLIDDDTDMRLCWWSEGQWLNWSDDETDPYYTPAWWCWTVIDTRPPAPPDPPDDR